jgi:hypothetical protein
MFADEQGYIFPHIQHMTTAILKSSISSHGIHVSTKPFHNKIDFSKGIDSVESIPGVIKSINRAQQGLANIGFGKQNEVTIRTLVFFCLPFYLLLISMSYHWPYIRFNALTLLLVILFYCLTSGDTSVSMGLPFYLLFILLSYYWRYIRFNVHY